MAMAKVPSTTKAAADAPKTASWWKPRARTPKEFLDISVSREDFLSRMPARGPSVEVYPSWEEILGSKAPIVQAAVSSPPCSPCLAPCAPPPGLEHILPPPGLSVQATEKAEEPVATQEPAPEAPRGMDTAEPKDFQVLLRHMPESLCNEPMILVMLEQAGLDQHIFSIETRPGGKALIAFSSLHWACQGIHHFNERQWESSEQPVSALYVRKVARTPAPAQAFNAAAQIAKSAAPVQEEAQAFNVSAPTFVPSPAFSFKADAPAFNFNPGSMMLDVTSSERDRSYSDASLSANAPVFQPGSMIIMMDKMKDDPRDRFYSDASTAVPTSEDASEDSEPEVLEVVVTKKTWAAMVAAA